MIQGAAVRSESWDASSEICTVMMEIPLAAIRTAVVVTIEAATLVPATPETPTGLVFDVRNLDAVPSVVFRVFTVSGVEVTASASGFYLTALPGGAGTAIDDAREDERVATRPFVIRAIGLRDNRVDLVISDADGERLRVYLGQRNYFRDERVIVVMN